MVLDKFFLKYEGGEGGGSQIDLPPEKTSLKKPSLTKVKDSKNFFIQSLPLYASCLFSMFLDDDIKGMVEYVSLLLL